MQINQNKEDFRQWLESLPPTEEAIAGDCNYCWIAKWIESQGNHVWSVNEGHSGEILLDDPEADDFDESDRIDLEHWVLRFVNNLDREYFVFRGDNYTTRDQALAILSEVDDD